MRGRLGFYSSMQLGGYDADAAAYIAADCLLEKEGIYKYVIQDMPMDDMQVLDEQEWLPYQAIITAQQQEEE